MKKRIFILNASGGKGKDTFAELCNEFIPTYHYSIATIIKEAAKVLDWKGGKSEKDRKFLSDLLILSAKYNDLPYRDVVEYIDWFLNYIIKEECKDAIVLIDMRNPNDIKRAVKDFDAETILIRSNRVEDITSNYADAGVYNYNYDYEIDNSGSIENLRENAKNFIETIKAKWGEISE